MSSEGRKRGYRSKSNRNGSVRKSKAPSSEQGMQRLQNMSFEEFENTISGLYNSEKDIYNNGLDDSYYMQNGTQALITQFGINGRPQVVGKGEVDAIAAENGMPVIYRGLKNSETITSQEIAQQMLYDTNNRIGGGVFGDGFYFTPKLSMAENYAGHGKGTVVKATLNPKTAKIIDHSAVRAELEKRSASFQTTLRWACDSPQWGNDGESVMALKMGYNVIKVGTNKYVVIDRSALIVEEV